MKKLLRIIGALLVLLILIATAVPFFISADYVKAKLAEQVKAATGRTLTIKGKASVSILPSIAVKLEDVTLGNPAGFSGKYFAHVNSLSLGAALKPLLNKQVQVTGITVDGATLNLEESASGAKNWDFGGGKKKAAPVKTQSAEGGKGDDLLTIDAIHIRNTVVSYRKAGAAPVKFDAKDINADIAMRGAETKLTLNRMALYEGSAKGVAKTDGRALALELDLAGIQIAPLMTALTGASKLAGAATVVLNVTGKGEGDALMRTLTGTGSMRIADGAIKGINIASFLRSAQKGFLMKDHTTEKTDFTELTASVKIAQGVVSNDDLAMKSPVLRLSGKGTVSLPDKTINYCAVPTLVASAQGQGGRDDLAGVAVPLIITGPWSSISVTPDVAGLVNEAIKNPAAIQQNLKGVKDAIGGFNSPKDLGKALFGGSH